MSTPNHPALRRIHRLDRSSARFHDQLSSILYGKEYQQCLYGGDHDNQQRVLILQGDDLKWIVGYLDEALDSLEPSSPAFRKYLRELRSICGASGVLPPSYTLSSSILEIRPKPFASGGFGDVYEATLDGSTVCVKRVRMYTDYPQKAIKSFCQEAVMWKRLTHPNIVPLLGVTIDPLQLISRWMTGGDLPRYIKNNPDADRLGLLSDAAEGLRYLHSCNVIHGDLKGVNILVDSSGLVCLADFGLATVTQNPNSMQNVSRPGGFTPGWTAPEILEAKETCSKKADIFSLAMVMIEVFTGATPFSHSSPYTTALAILRGERPHQPTHPTFTEDLWVLAQRCWDKDPHRRPEVPEVLDILHSLSVSRPFLQQLRRLNRSSSGFHDQLTKILYGEDYQQCAPKLQGNDLVWLVNYLDKALDGLEPSSPAFRKYLRELQNICTASGVLPPSYTLSSSILKIGPKPFASGSFSDVYRGTLNGSAVCAKCARVSAVYSQEATYIFCQEAVIWKYLIHPNIVPLLGVTINPPQLISDLMSGGELPRYINDNPHADRLGLLSDVANGLYYLHSCNVIHGNLKGKTILVDDSGRVRLAGFVFATVTQNPNSVESTPPRNGYTPRWAAPELLRGDERSEKVDIFSFAMVVIEVFTGTVPFDNLTSFAALVAAVVNGKRPPRPTHPAFTEGLWALTQRCWDQDPHLRPEASKVLQVLTLLRSRGSRR